MCTMGKDRLRKSSCEKVKEDQTQVVLQRMVYVLFITVKFKG